MPPEIDEAVFSGRTRLSIWASRQTLLLTSADTGGIAGGGGQMLSSGGPDAGCPYRQLSQPDPSLFG